MGVFGKPAPGSSTAVHYDFTMTAVPRWTRGFSRPEALIKLRTLTARASTARADALKVLAHAFLLPDRAPTAPEQR
jgi:hypothetical protein